MVIKQTPRPTPSSLGEKGRVAIVDRESAETKSMLIGVLAKIDKIDSLLNEQLDLNSGAVEFSWDVLKEKKLTELDSYLDSVIQQLEHVNSKAKDNRVDELAKNL